LSALKGKTMALDGPFRRHLWVRAIFSAGHSNSGSIVRRPIKPAVENYLIEEVRKRGYHLIKTKSEYVIFCQKDPPVLVC
jgi:hypothetical protein